MSTLFVYFSRFLLTSLLFLCIIVDKEAAKCI
nr:MAG TPA: hypothetical protein [Caudoviricetes sp.]